MTCSESNLNKAMARGMLGSETPSSSLGLMPRSVSAANGCPAISFCLSSCDHRCQGEKRSGDSGNFSPHATLGPTHWQMKAWEVLLSSQSVSPNFPHTRKPFLAGPQPSTTTTPSDPTPPCLARGSPKPPL
jgi:hypothetical protein